MLGQRLLGLAHELTSKDTTGQVSNAVGQASGSVPLLANVTTLWNHRAEIVSAAGQVASIIMGLIPLFAATPAPAAPTATPPSA